MSKTQAMTRREQMPVGKTATTIGDLLYAKVSDLAVVAPRGFDMASLVPKFLSRASRNPDLLACTPLSVYTTVHECVQLGLEPMSPHGHYYVIPRRNKHQGNAMEATGMLGYKGMIELARRSGQVRKVFAALVYEGEEFTYDRGTGEIHHPYKLGIDRSDAKIVAAYAYAVLNTGEVVCPDPLDRNDIEKRRGRSMARNSGPWVTDYPAMARKTALRALFGSGMVPMTRDLAEQLEREEEREREDERADAPVSVTVTPTLPEPQEPALPAPDRVPGWDDDAPAPVPQEPDQAAHKLDMENRITEACRDLNLSPKWLSEELSRRYARSNLGTCSVEELEALCGELEARTQ